MTRDIINRHLSTHSEFEYYTTIIDKIENNFINNPDISIEACKALIEGICKTILLKLENSFTLKIVNSMEFPELFKKACLSINRFCPFEIDFIHRTSSMICRMAELRNERGDISHGKSAPKEVTSTKESAKMIMHVTDGITSYILGSFFKIDLTYKEEIQYDDYPVLNEMLDEENPLDGISYSRALFDQDNVAYMEQFSNILDIQDSYE
ncbi:MAG: abortive infection family protein [Candidatus Marinimicrobia bacterium]|nr:abortive infection family protein [Candidatus Neomarinimicrobiota bacterium]